ncbi:ferritin family protein [Candidatus Margulisiibacteriota bacterium]
MDCVFSIEELLDFAIKIEEEGISFYNAMASKTKKNDLKELYEFLAEEEVSHKKTYSQLLENIKATENPSDFNDDYNRYMRAFVDSVIFHKADQKKEFSSDLEVIEYAIEKEKDSILYYKSLIDCIAEKDRDVVEKVIEEERLHVLKMLDIKEKIG